MLFLITWMTFMTIASVYQEDFDYVNVPEVSLEKKISCFHPKV